MSARLGNDGEMSVGQPGPRRPFLFFFAMEIPGRERDGSLKGVLDLPTVPASAGFVLVQFPTILSKLHDAFTVHVDVKITTLNARKVHFPDFPSGCLIEFRIIKAYVNAALKGLVKLANAVRRQYEDTGIILQDS